MDLTQRKIGAWNESDAKQYLVRFGDFLVARGNGSKSLVGRGGLVDHVPDDVAYPDTLIRIRVDDRQIRRDYLRVVWDSNFVREQIEAAARTTAGIYKINQQHLRRFIIPLPPLAEQERIVAEVERRLSVVATLEQSVEANLKRAARLRQSILKRAFDGKLVPQDPNDEPACALLERIRTSQAGRSGSGKQTRSSKKAAAESRRDSPGPNNRQATGSRGARGGLQPTLLDEASRPPRNASKPQRDALVSSHDIPGKISASSLDIVGSDARD